MMTTIKLETREDVYFLLKEIKKIERQTYEQKDLYLILERLKQKWSDPSYPLRQEALEKLPLITGFSREMVALALSELSALFDTTLLQKKIDTELQGIPLVPELFHDQKEKRLLQWRPLGTILHVLSGNVFLVGVSSWLEGVLTGNISLLKMPSDEIFFMPLFLKSVAECDPEGVLVGRAFLVSYSSSRSDIIAELEKIVDGVVVWGGEKAVVAYRNHLPVSKRLIVFGPKVSIALITDNGIKEKSHSQIAKLLAQEIAIWDQAACTAPQVCYLLGDQSQENAKKIVELLPIYLDEQESQLPQGRVEKEAAAEIRKLRHLYEMMEIQGVGTVKCSQENLKWTVLLEVATSEFTPSPLYRTLKIIPIRSLDEMRLVTTSLKGYLQTVGLVAGRDEYIDLSQKFLSDGALRIMPLGSMFSGSVDDPHDGKRDLTELLNLTVTHLPVVDDADNLAISLSLSMKKLLQQAKKSAWYKKRLEGLSELNDWTKIPIMTKEVFAQVMPPLSYELATEAHPYGGHITRSGGSTGAPKFSWFTDHDWQKQTEVGATVFRSAGLSKADIVANCFLSGDLYGSFISFGDVNREVGMTSLPFAGKVTPESLIDIWKRFHFNVLEGVPAHIFPILRKAKALDPTFTFEKFLYAGEPLSLADRSWIIDQLQVRNIISILGTTEAGAIAYQDHRCSDKEYYLIPESVHVEVVDAKGNVLPSGNRGRLIVTPLFKLSFPLIRYDLGDEATLISPFKMIYHGRHDNIVCVGLMNFNYEDLINCLNVNRVDLVALQLVVDRKNDQDQLDIYLETLLCEKLNALMIKEIMFREMAEVKDHVEGGFLNLTIHLLPPGSIKRDERTGKVKRLIDRRLT